MSEVIYVWSTDEERFVDNGCKTREDALADARQEHDVVEGTVWTGVQVPIVVDNLARGWGLRILEGIVDDLADEYGDLVDGMFSEVTKEQEKTLDDRIVELFAQWTKEIGFEPKFWGVADVQEHQVYAIEIGDIVSCDALGPEQRDATVIGEHKWSNGMRSLKLRANDTGFEFSEDAHKCTLVRKGS